MRELIMQAAKWLRGAERPGANERLLAVESLVGLAKQVPDPSGMRGVQIRVAAEALVPSRSELARESARTSARSERTMQRLERERIAANRGLEQDRDR